MAARAVIYGLSGDAVCKIDNTHRGSTPLPAAGAVIYGIFGDVAPEIGNTHGDSAPRAAKRLTLSRNCSLVRRISRFLSVRLGTQVARLPYGTPKYGAFGPKAAPFSNERRVSFPEPPPLSGT